MYFFNLSKKDIRSLTLFYKICEVLAIIPTTDFEASHKKRSVWTKVKGFLLISAIFVGTGYSLYIRYIHFKDIYTTTHLILDYIDEFFIVMLAFTVIFSSSFCHQEDWIKLNQNLQCIDKVLNNNDVKEKNLFRNTSLQFLVYSLFYIFGVVFLLYTWTQEKGFKTIEAYAMHQFCYAYDAVLNFLIYGLSSGLKHRYADLNSLLEAECTERWDKRVVISLRRIANISQYLTDTVELFNKIFGTVLIFITGKSIAQLLTCLNFLTHNLKGDTILQSNIFIANFMLVIYTLGSVSFVMIECDNAAVASKKIVATCYRLQENFVTKSDARSELFKLAQQISSNAAIITAANFFEIDKSTLFGIFGTTTTYFIIILQFNQSLTS